jgi:adenosyl cobinamide kinase/adenosyl cobinamide phosphate guanylyltransferase
VIALVLGGARSGKSAVAEGLASEAAGELQPVNYVATSVPGPDDADLAARIAAHVRRRPGHWTTEEVGLGGDLPRLLRECRGVVLVDSLGTWVAGAPGLTVDAEELVAALREREGATILVSDEVGLGVHPETEAGRRFRDELGTLNQAVAAVADRVMLVVAGRVLALEPPGPAPTGRALA